MLLLFWVYWLTNTLKTNVSNELSVFKNERAINRQIASTFEPKKKFVTPNISEKGSYQPELARTNSINQNWRARNSPRRVTLTSKSFRDQTNRTNTNKTVRAVTLRVYVINSMAEPPPLDPFMF